MAAVLNWKSFGNVYNDILVEQRSIDWFLLGYEEGSKNHIRLLKKGDGGLNAMKTNLNDSMVAFGYLKVYPTNNEKKDQETPIQPDFVHITFIGKRVKAQERARAVVHRLDIQQAFPRYIIEFDASTVDELDMDVIREKIDEMKGLLAE
ncbi:Coactosin-like protein [Tritrichomonas musculus]|uniref:Coactosin-like protein n=1 Tax=Tritrichomonas musculus TaxID=1915356 RepID=A0ABR2JC52_9EUKA